MTYECIQIRIDDVLFTRNNNYTQGRTSICTIKRNKESYETKPRAVLLVEVKLI